MGRRSLETLQSEEARDLAAQRLGKLGDLGRLVHPVGGLLAPRDDDFLQLLDERRIRLEDRCQRRLVDLDELELIQRANGREAGLPPNASPAWSAATPRLPPESGWIETPARPEAMTNIEEVVSPSRTTVSPCVKRTKRAPFASRCRSSRESGAKSALESTARATAPDQSGRGSGPAAYWCWRITGYAMSSPLRASSYQALSRTRESISRNRA
jgi:hypothetical protein